MKHATTLVLAALLVFGSIGCSSDGERSPPAVASGGTYVALGSSIASGFGISEQSTDCGRSNRSYPNLLAARLDLTLTDVTCGASVGVSLYPDHARDPEHLLATADEAMYRAKQGA